MISYYKKQMDFLNSQVKEVAMLASMGAGKSFILGEWVAHYLQEHKNVDHPTRKGHGVHMLVLCSTVTTMTDTIIQDIESSFDRYNMQFHRTINSKKFIVVQTREDGTQIKNYIYLRTSEKRGEIRGFRVHATIMEEALICHPDCWLKMRQRTNLGKKPLLRVISSFPYTKKNHLYKLYGPRAKRATLQVIAPTLFDNCYRDNALNLMIDQCLNTYMMKLKTTSTIEQLIKLIEIYWEFSAYDDNKALKILKDIEDVFVPESITPEARAEVFSQWVDIGTSNAYRSFKPKVHLVKKPDFPQKKFGQIFIGMDFNRTPYTILLAQYYNGKLHVYKEHQLPNHDSEMASEMMAEYVKEHGYDHWSWHAVVSDSTGGNQSTKPFTDWDYIEAADLNLEDTANPFYKNRVNNVNRWFKTDRIEIDPDECPTLVEELEIASMEEMEDKKEGKLYHASVVLGYLTWFIEPTSSENEPNARIH